MPQTRDQLQSTLDALDAAVPALVRGMHAPGAFWARFTEMANDIQQQASPDDRAWACDRLDAIQVKHHLVPPGDSI